LILALLKKELQRENLAKKRKKHKKSNYGRHPVQKCPSCMVERDTCAHVLYCCHQGRVEMLRNMLELMEEWLVDAKTEPDLLNCIMEYAHGRGGQSIENICSGLGQHFMQIAREQETP
jgi:hypothetical protein